MTTYSICNPSDPYTLLAEDPKVAYAVVILLGNGKYGIDNLDDPNAEIENTMIQLLPSQKDVDDFQVRVFGEMVVDWAWKNADAVIACLDSVLCGEKKDRAEYEEVLAGIGEPEARLKWHETWYEQHRTSGPLCGLAAGIAEKMRSWLAEKERGSGG